MDSRLVDRSSSSRLTGNMEKKNAGAAAVVPLNLKSALKETTTTAATPCISPVTDLAKDLGGLTTGYIATPKRRITWSADSSASTPRAKALSEGSDLVRTPTIPVEDRLFRDVISRENTSTRTSLPVHQLFPSSPHVACSLVDKENLPREIGSVLSPFKNCSQEPHDGNSQDSGYSSCQMDKDASSRGNFLEPRHPSRKGRQLSQEFFSCNTSAHMDRRFSAPCIFEEEYLESFHHQNLNEDTQFPSGISELLQNPLTFSGAKISRKHQVMGKEQEATCSDENQTTMKVPKSCIRGLLANSGICTERLPFKRPEPPLTEPFQLNQKRRRKAASFPSEETDDSDTETCNLSLVPKRVSILQRSYSETEATIMRAVQRSSLNPDLIGDFSQPYRLPIVRGRHQDLKSILPETVMKLVAGDYQDQVKQHIIVDCRYPYEYEAGHIKGAKNIYTKDGILKEFLCNPQESNENFHPLVVFHCEFSSERGPNLIRFLRSKDREVNGECYPALHYPEIYVLDGGYKAFYECFQSFCEPEGYKSMMDKRHEDDLKHFRAKSKSLNTEGKGRLVHRPGLKF